MGEPLFNCFDRRSAGVLMHLTSLPNQYVVGNFGPSARAFVDLMTNCSMSYWQVLPLGPTGYGDSPYQAYSSHALNPYLIDLDDLIQKGWITEQDVSPLLIKHPDAVDYDRLGIHHKYIVERAIKNGLKDKRYTSDYHSFKKEHQSWVKHYSLFMALKKANNGAFWDQWKKEHRNYEIAVKSTFNDKILEDAEAICFEQFILLKQWFELKKYANDKGIEIIGDIPIYVAPDSVDVWANRSVFQMTKTGKASKLAGVPPDYFNSEGQFWGNPLYDWKALKETNFKWWVDRLDHTIKLYDIVRFDHFRALETYWSIPAKAKSAKEGKWVKGPGKTFFKAIKDQLPHAKMILEDLGEITQAVIDLKMETGFPGLAVLQFAFGGDASNFYLPHNVGRNTVIYTGTHDNDTSRGWYESADEKSRDHLRRYFQVSGEEASWDLIRAAYKSNAQLCIIPTQDLINAGTSARMNRPGVATGNWSWRMNDQSMFDLGKNSAEYLRYLATLYGRK